MRIVLLVCLLAICMAAVKAGEEDMFGFSMDSCSRHRYRSRDCESCCRGYKRIPATPLAGTTCTCKETEAGRAARKERAKYLEFGGHHGRVEGRSWAGAPLT